MMLMMMMMVVAMMMIMMMKKLLNVLQVFPYGNDSTVRRGGWRILLGTITHAITHTQCHGAAVSERTFVLLAVVPGYFKLF
jgi:hypothetical protein